MAAGNYDILIEQGATFELTMEVKSDPTVAYPEGQVVDLTDVVISGQIRPTTDSPLVLAEFVGTVVNPPDTSGLINLVIPATVTASIDTEMYLSAVYDILLLFPSGMVRRLIQGDVEISPGVTR